VHIQIQSEGKGSLGRPRHMWEDDIKPDLKETCFEDMNWNQNGLG